MTDPESINPAPPPGWYHDANGVVRWWDGIAWGEPLPAPTPGPVHHSGGWTWDFDGLHLLPPYGRLAAPSHRIVARVVDMAILYVPMVVVYFIVMFGGAANTGDPTPFLAVYLVVIAAFAVVPAIYEVVFIALWGATPGKMIMGVRVVRELDGQVPGWGPSLLRWVPTLVGLVPCIGNYILLPGLWIWALVNLFNDSKRQTPFDQVAKTVVIQTR